ncbi:MAG: hypothetical protein ACP5JS_06930 [Fervidobacterium sp.]
MRISRWKNSIKEFFEFFITAVSSAPKSIITWLIEYILVVSIVYLMFQFSFIRLDITIILLLGTVFIWSSRYGLFAFIVTISIFELIFSYICKSNSISLSKSLTIIFSIGFGLVTGVIGEILNKKIRTTENENTKCRMENVELRGQIDKLKTIIDQLELRVYFEGQGMINLLEKLQELEILDLDEMLTRSVEIIADFFGLKNLHLYKNDNYFLRYVAGVGQKRLPNSFEPKISKVISGAIENGYASLPGVILEDNLEQFEPWFAVSVGKGENTFGVLIVDDIEPEKFSQTLILYMHAIASWLGANIKIITEQSQLLEQKYKNPDGTWKEEYYLQKKKVLQKRQERFGTPYQELCIIYPKHLHLSIIKEFRNSDIFMANQVNDQFRLNVLLAVCDEIGKKKILERLIRKYEIEVC